MSASITDKFNKAADSNGVYPTLGVVSTSRAAGVTTLACQDLTGWATDTPVHFSTYRLSASGTVDTTTQTDWKGIVSDNTITNLTRIAGAADTGSSIGDIVQLNPTYGWVSDMVTGLLASHNQDGTLKNNAVTTASITDSAVTTDKVADSAVTSSKVDWTTLPQSIGTDDDNNTSYLYIGDILIQWGIKKGLRRATNTTINFPKTFANANYSITLTNYFPETAGSHWWAFVNGKNAGSFTARAGFSYNDNTGGGENTDNIVSWIAIGKKA